MTVTTPSVQGTQAPVKTGVSDGSVTFVPGPPDPACVARLIRELARVTAHR